MSCFETVPTQLLEKFSLEKLEIRVGVYVSGGGVGAGEEVG